MKVSVILPTFDRAYVVAEAIQSVLDQTYPDFELIVVDDGSTDGTAGIVREFRDDRLRLIQHPKNAGYAIGLNTGLTCAKGEFIAFQDSDDLWKPEKLKVQVAFLESHPDAGGVFSDLEWFRGQNHRVSMLNAYPRFTRLVANKGDKSEMIFSQHELYVCLLEEMPVKLVASTLRRDCVTKVGLFKESWKSGPDWEFLLRFARANAFGYVDTSLTVVRTMADSTLARHRKSDAVCLMDRFIQEKRIIHDDADAMAAVRRGIANQANEIGWQFLEEGDRANAVKAYCRGFGESFDIKLLVRAAAVPVPRRIRMIVKQLREASKS